MQSTIPLIDVLRTSIRNTFDTLDDLVNGQVTEEAEANLNTLIAHIDDELQITALSEGVAVRDGPQARASVLLRSPPQREEAEFNDISRKGSRQDDMRSTFTFA